MTKRAKRIVWSLAVSLALATGLVAYYLLLIDHNPILKQWQTQTTKLVIIDSELRYTKPEKAVLAQLTTRKDIDVLLDLIRVKPESRTSSFVCSCFGNPHLELHDADGCFETIEVRHGQHITCSVGKGNLWIKDENVPKLVDYFAELGMALYVLRRNEGHNPGVERPSGD
jgi:hypothetical protein